MTNSEDPDQTATQGAVWSGLQCFVSPYLSLYLEFYGIQHFKHYAKY